jgi:hypothetical protein
MWRHFALCLLMLVTGGDLGAQAPVSRDVVVRLGLGLSSADYSCTACEINAETGVNAFVAATRPLGRRLTAGLEAIVSDASSDRTDVKLLGALATAGLRGGPRMPVWGTLGLGWLFWSGPGPNSNGPALSVRAGVDLPVGARVALSPYAGYLTMLADDGPHHVQDFTNAPEGVPTRVSSLQLGLAATLRLW